MTEDVPTTQPITPPRRKQGPYCWDLERVRRARDEQLQGKFELPVRLAEAFRTDDALFNAYNTRVAAQGAVKLCMYPGADTPTARNAADYAEEQVILPRPVRDSLLGTMANHGLAIGYCDQDVIENGQSIKFTLREWPLEHVYYTASDGLLRTRVLDGPAVPIVHGNGRWVVFSKFGAMPWTQDAALLPAALLWVARANGLSDWSRASQSHGEPKLIGQLAEGVRLGADGALTVEAQSMLNVLASLASGDTTAGVIPGGAKAELLFNESTAWQVFKELILNRDSAAARVYLGTDAILGATGGAPGVDIDTLFKVAGTRIQGDFEALERGYYDGVLRPWGALRGLTLANVPRAKYELPDPDKDRRGEQEANAIKRFGESLKSLRDSQVVVDQVVVDAVARSHGVTVPIIVASADESAPPIPLAPTDLAKVVRVREARAGNGLPLLGDERDDLTISELDAQAKAAAAPPVPAPADPNAPTPDAAPAETPTPAPAETPAP